MRVTLTLLRLLRPEVESIAVLQKLLKTPVKLKRLRKLMLKMTQILRKYLMTMTRSVNKALRDKLLTIICQRRMILKNAIAQTLTMRRTLAKSTHVTSSSFSQRRLRSSSIKKGRRIG